MHGIARFAPPRSLTARLRTAALNAALTATAFAFVATAAPATHAASPSWRVSLSGPVVDTVVPSAMAGERVLVTALGDHGGELDRALDVLVTVVGVRVPGVSAMTSGELGLTTRRLDEQRVVRAAAEFGPTRLVALRLVRPGGAQPPMASVVGFQVAADGSLIQVGSVVVTAGQPPVGLAPAPTPARAAPTPLPPQVHQAAPVPTYRAPVGVDPYALQRAMDTRKTMVEELYAERRIRYSESMSFTFAPFVGARAIGVSRFYLGESTRPMAPQTFYETVGRQDLAQSYRRKRATKLGLTWGGFGAAIAGAAMMGASFAVYDPFSGGPYWDDVGEYYYGGPGDEEAFIALMTAGSILAITGTVLAIVGASMTPHPVRAEVRHKLAEAYNEGVWAEVEGEVPLDVPGYRPEDLPPPPPLKRPAAKVTGFGIGPTRDGATLALSGVF